MVSFIYVAIGGAAGATLRYGIGQAAAHAAMLPSWVVTLVVNVVGSFLIAFLSIWGQRQYPDAIFFRPLLITGFCGGFTTFSTFTAESYVMFREGAYGLALLYIAGSVLIGLLALWVGLYVSRIIAS